MHRKHIPLTDFDMMILQAGWLPRTHMGEPKPGNMRSVATLQCRICRKVSHKLKGLAAALDEHALRV